MRVIEIVAFWSFVDDYYELRSYEQRGIQIGRAGALGT